MRRNKHRASIDQRCRCSEGANYACSDSPSNVKWYELLVVSILTALEGDFMSKTRIRA
jgi:hypothetical protein